MRIFKHANGTYYVRFFTQHGSRQLSLKTKNQAEAEQRVRDSRIANIERLAKATALTADAVSQAVTGKTMTCADAFQVWLDWTSVVGFSPATVRVYSLNIQRLIADNQLMNANPSAITDRMLVDWVNQFGLSASARSNRLRAARSFVEVLSTKNIILGNPIKGIRVNKDDLTFAQKEVEVREPFTSDEVTRLLSSLPTKWRAPAVVALDAGLRINDVANLEWDSVRADGKLIVHTDKFDKRIAFPMTPRLRDALLSVDRVHPRWVFPELQAVASNPKDRPKLSTEFGRAAVKAGVTGKTFHNFRHTFATQLKDAGNTVDEIREKLGHSLEATTQGYIHTP